MADGKSCTHVELIARVVALEANLVALRQVLDERDERYKQRAASQDSAVKLAIETSEKAITKAETATEKRFEGVNEFRQTLADQAATLMPRAEFNVQHTALTERINTNEGRMNRVQQDISVLQSRGNSLKDAWGYLIGFVGIIIAGLAVYFHR